MSKAKKVVQDVSGLVEQFRSYVQKSTDSILEMARVVVEAKKLGRKEFAAFCDAIGFQPKSGTIRKYVRIGERYEIFKLNQSSLPFNWTTLYTISQIDTAKLKPLFDDGKIHANMTGKEAAMLVGKKTNKKISEDVRNGTLSGYGIRVHFDKMPKDTNAYKLKMLMDKLAEFGAEIELSPSLEAFFQETDELLAA